MCSRFFFFYIYLIDEQITSLILIQLWGNLTVIDMVVPKHYKVYKLLSILRLLAVQKMLADGVFLFLIYQRE